MDTLRDRLKDWTDFDVAQHHLGVCLGLFPASTKFSDQGLKVIFWSRNPVGDALTHCLEHLVDAGVLERNDQEGQYRWRENYHVP